MAEPAKKKPRPVPTPSSFTKPFWEATKRGKLLLQHCPRCRTWQYYPRPVCMKCMSRELEWREASGKGTIYSFTITRLPPEGFEDQAPYAIAAVELPEGTRVMAHILNCPAEELRIGMKVRAAFEKLSDEVTLLQFEPDR